MGWRGRSRQSIQLSIQHAVTGQIDCHSTHFVNEETQKPRRQYWIAHPDVIARPRTFEPAGTAQIDGTVQLILDGGGVDLLQLRGDDGKVLVEKADCNVRRGR